MPKIKKEKNKTHTLIISDLHLGSGVSQPEKALKLLKSFSFRKLILLGDVFDSLDFRHLSAESWELLNYIGKISRDKKVRWVRGNHDNGLPELFRTLMNAQVYETYAWQFKHEKYLAMHGHQFDRFLVDNVILSNVATAAYSFIQKIDFNDRRISHYVKRKSKGWLRLSEKVARGAIAAAREYDAKYVFCGHTHKALEKVNGHYVKYYNSGCWTDTPCTYITIDEKDIAIREY
ncbi:MAG: metallophosphoesterase [Parcubacteria group bacterium]